MGLILASCLLCNFLEAQTPAPLQGWWQIYLKHKTEKNWLVEADAGYRVHSFHFEPNTALFRAGFGRQFKDFSVVVGGAWFETWPKNQSAPGTAELRLFQKLTLPQRVGKLSLNHIYRVEERWFQQAAIRTQYKMQLRLRYQLQVIYPIKNASFLGASPFAIGHGEIFLRPGKGVFSQFRLYGGLGLNWKDRCRLDLGYLAIWLPPRRNGNPLPGQALRTSLTVTL